MEGLECDRHEEGMEGADLWAKKGGGTRTGKNVILKPNRYIIHYIYTYICIIYYIILHFILKLLFTCPCYPSSFSATFPGPP